MDLNNPCDKFVKGDFVPPLAIAIESNYQNVDLIPFEDDFVYLIIYTKKQDETNIFEDTNLSFRITCQD